MPNKKTITKRIEINNSIFKELKEKWPSVAADNGVEYKQKLEYLTFETDFLEDPLLNALVSQWGFGVILVIFYTRIEMCKNGWKVRMDGIYYDALVNRCSFVCKLDTQYIQDVLQALIDNKFMFVVQDNQIEEGMWLTCTQQVFNYEMACQRRLENRNRQKKYRAKSNAQENQPISKEEVDNTPFGISKGPEGANNNSLSFNTEEQVSYGDPFGLGQNTPPGWPA